MIRNPNSSGQGYDEDHGLNPYHALLLSQGFSYSHTTPVAYDDGRRMYHTYKRGLRSIGVVPTSARQARSWSWRSTSRPGSGSSTTGVGEESLIRHLRNIKRARGQVS